MSYFLELFLVSFVGIAAVVFHVLDALGKEERDKTIQELSIKITKRFAEKLEESRHHQNLPGQ